MAEYIDKSAVIANIDEFVKINESYGFPVDIFDMEMLKKRIEQIPAADVAQVVHGHWIKRKHGLRKIFYHSSCCHLGFSKTGDDNYCNYCGAKMDEEVKK